MEIVDCVAASDSPWFVGDYGFVLRNPVSFETPIPCRGALSFWNVPEGLLPAMREQWLFSQGGRLTAAAGSTKDLSGNIESLTEERKA